MGKHFELTDTNINNGYGIKLHQIIAIRDSKHALKGELGGYIQSLDNLCDEAWVGGDAQVWGNAKVSDNAKISGNAQIYGKSIILDNAEISGNTKISGNAWVANNAKISGDVKFSYDVKINHNAQIESYNDVCYFNHIGDNNSIIAFKCSDSSFLINCKEKYGTMTYTLKEFEQKTLKNYSNTKEYELLIKIIKDRFK